VELSDEQLEKHLVIHSVRLLHLFYAKYFIISLTMYITNIQTFA